LPSQLPPMVSTVNSGLAYYALGKHSPGEELPFNIKMWFPLLLFCVPFKVGWQIFLPDISDHCLQCSVDKDTKWQCGNFAGVQLFP